MTFSVQPKVVHKPIPPERALAFAESFEHLMQQFYLLRSAVITAEPQLSQAEALIELRSPSAETVEEKEFLLR